MAGGATISLLPVSLSLVHIPRSRIQDLFHPIIRQILLPKPAFLNITCNEIELSVFADHHASHDFDAVIRADARKLRATSRERSRAGSKSDKKKSARQSGWEPVEMSSERWNVLQIDSHSDGLDNSGARVHELSAPLAAAGISILYQSSYMSDFIFVKEYRLAEVMALLGSAGFDLYQSDPENLTSQLSTLTSPILSPLANAADDEASSIHLLDLTAPTAPGISTENGAVLTRSRSSTDAGSVHTSSSSPSLSRKASVRLLQEQDDDESASVAAANGVKAESKPSHGGKPTLLRSQSHSPSGSDVRVLEPDLTCIGLSDNDADVWGLKIIKLVAYPDLIPPVHARSSSRRRQPNHESFADAELASAAELGIALADPSDTSCEIPFDAETDEDADNTEHADTESESVGSRSDDTTRVGDSPTPSDPDSQASSPVFDLGTPIRWDEVDASRREEDVQSESDDDRSMYASPSAFPSELDAEEDVHAKSLAGQAPLRRPHLLHVETNETIVQKPHARPSTKPPKSRKSASVSSPAPPPPPPLVPFFSFTRTPEGSSLTAPVGLLAALFPAEERHMVICSGELDVLDSRAGSPTAGIDGDDDDEQEDGGDEKGTLKCLQIDLTKFGLDKHGLVNRYSRTLEDNGINHMYSSTYKTANLLVDKAHARRAQLLLRSC